MKTKLLLFSLLCFSGSLLSAQEVIPLWSNSAPGALGDKDEDKPTLTLFPAPKDINTGTAVVICPGGGYTHLAFEKEGTEFAKWFNSFGVSAYVVKYRLNTPVRHYQYPAMFDDATRAMRYVRAHSAEWNINPDKIGIMGFSAGGHLASTVGTHFDQGNANATDNIEKASSRPNFMILGYPVITMNLEFTHRGSHDNLLGKNPTNKMVKYLSNELQVKSNTPATFLALADDDRTVPPQNSVAFYLALKKAGIPAEMHIYNKGGHGFGMAKKDPNLSKWVDNLKNWLITEGFVQKKGAE
ncbi:MAG: alpha/beta hydrolase [Bacteroidota bacterium]|nr:alpha/beta hydrolase [Bacteroidota bacterium]MDP4272909.1 alpha/beta hydrolase [Bacteroidota bacterium]